MEALASAFPDWANLPVVHLISEKIKCIKDHVRFRAVCHPWRSNSLSKPCHLPLQLPWLMIPSPKIRKRDDGNRLFYDLWEAKMRKIHLPETISKMCYATYHGWLLLVAPGGTEVFLLNPLTRARVELPSFTIPVKHDINHIDDDEQYYRLTRNVGLLFDEEIITKITFSADLTDPNCIIMVLFQLSPNETDFHLPRGPFFCKVGDYCWTEVIQPDLMEPVPLIDAAYNNGNFYLLLDCGIYIYDLDKLNGENQYIFKPELKSVSKYFLVGNKSGLYIVTERNFEDDEGDEEEAEETIEEAFQKPPKPKIELYQFIDTEPQMKLKWIADTNDITIFYSDNHHYLAVCADGWDSLDGSCMYIKHNCSFVPGNELKLYTYADKGFKHGPRYSIFSSKLDDRKSELVVFGLGKISSSPIWPSQAFWFQPTFE